MLKRATLFFALILSTFIVAMGQNKVLPNDPSIFADSVSTLLNETRANSAMEIGDNFALIWSQLGLDQQQKVIAQMKSLEEKEMKLRPYLQAYAAVLVNAIQIEAGVQLCPLSHCGMSTRKGPWFRCPPSCPHIDNSRPVFVPPGDHLTVAPEEMHVRL